MATGSESAEARKTRQIEAVARFQRGARPADVARAAGVSRQTACRWYRRYKSGGAAALLAAKPGRSRKLSPAAISAMQRRYLADLVESDVRGKRFPIRALQRMIRAGTGTSYHLEHVRRLARAWDTDYYLPRRAPAEARRELQQAAAQATRSERANLIAQYAERHRVTTATARRHANGTDTVVSRLDP